MKLTIIDKVALVALGVFILIFPVSNGYIAMGIAFVFDALASAIDISLTQISVVGAGFFQIPATILGLYIGYVVYGFIQKDNKINMPKKDTDTKKAGKFIVTK